MMLRDLEPGDNFTLVSTGIQYQYEGYKNHHRTGFMHWVIKDGIKTAYNFNTKVNKVE